MNWDPWSKIDVMGLARYIHDEAAWRAAAITLKINRLDVEGMEGGRRRITEDIYNRLRDRQPRITYDWELFERDEQLQKIRTPYQILTADCRGTCLDLALLFCALCLKNNLLPYVLMVQGHALAAVHLLKGRNSQGTGWDKVTGTVKFDSGDDILNLIDQNILLPVECTGFAHSENMARDCPEGHGRADGFLNFENAVKAGRAQIEKGIQKEGEKKGPRSFEFAINIHYLQNIKGLQPIAPPDWSLAVPTARGPDIPAEHLSWLASRMLGYGDFQDKRKRDRLAGDVCDNWKIQIRDRPDNPQTDLYMILTKVFQQPDGQRYFETLLPFYFAKFPWVEHLRDFVRSLSALVDLRPLLAQANFDRRALRLCYEKSLHGRPPKPDVDSVETALRDLLDLTPSRQRPWKPLSEFVERIARLCNSDPLRAWVEVHETDAASRDGLYADLNLEGVKAIQYIVIDVPSPKADGIEYWHFDCNNISRRRTSQATAASLADAVALLAGKAAEEFLNVRFEIFLPMEMLASDLDQWLCKTSLETYPLYEQHALVVRWRERARDGRLQRHWETFVAQLEQRHHEGPILRWLDTGCSTDPDLAKKVRSGEFGHCLAFRFSPFAAGPQAPHDLLKAALWGGMAYGIWPRRDPADPSAFCEALRQVFDKGDLEGMPERIKEARNMTCDPNSENPFRNLTVLWDDPRRNPWLEKLTQPSQARKAD